MGNRVGQQPQLEYRPTCTHTTDQLSVMADYIPLIKSDIHPKQKFKELINHLAHSAADIDATGEHRMTALHFAVLNGDYLNTKALIAFGANLNAKNEYEQTPLDMAIQNGRETITLLLVSIGCETGEALRKAPFSPPLPPSPLATSPLAAVKVEHYDTTDEACAIATTCSPGAQPKCTSSVMTNFGTPPSNHALKYEIEHHIERRFELSKSVIGDEAVAVALQQQEISKFQSRNQLLPGNPSSPFEFHVKQGNCILSLDGGGIRGLIQIEVLSEIEKLTGKRITELFDWIIGTSTGAILALGLVYGHKTLSQLRQLYFKLRERIFADARGGFACNSSALEDLLKEELGTTIRMCDIQQPKVLVCAVDKKEIPLKLHFFNNCFNDDYSTQHVWKVARYTSAAPMYFTECDSYVDGGVLANNPCDSGLSRIQMFCRQNHLPFPIACVVSVGSGIYPTEKLGSTDAHEHLNIGKLMNIGDAVRKTHNLVKLLSAAIGESEAVSHKCKTFCTEQQIPFYRFSPYLDERIEPGETDGTKLLNMMIRAKMCTHQDVQMGRLVSLLHKVLWMRRDEI